MTTDAPTPNASMPPDSGAMPFRGHLVELRGRMLNAAIGVTIGFFIAWGYHVELYEFISSPVRSAMADNALFTVRAIEITESIAVYVKIALIGGLFIASPWVWYQVWAFIAPGLLKEERRFVLPVVSASVIFFVAGAAFCYLVVLPFMTDFLIAMTIQGNGVELEPTLKNVVSYSLWLLLAFGLVFELPIFMYFLAVMGLVNAKGLLAFYRYWVVIAFIIGALLTPTPDPINQLLMSGPLVVLYGVGVGVAWIVEQDANSGSRLSWRAASVLVMLLTASALVGGVRLHDMAERRPIDDIPVDALQVVGVRMGSLGRALQLADDRGKHALGPMAAAVALGGRPDKTATLWLARFSDGAAVVMKRDGALAQVRKKGRAHMVSEVDYAGGRSFVVRLEGADALWRVAAPDDKTLWIGADAAVGRLASVRAGRKAAIGSDERLSMRMMALRATAPLFSLSADKLGVKGWLPSGALAGEVDLVTATVSPKVDKLTMTYTCRGPDSASGLRNRLSVWAADNRKEAKPRSPEFDELRGALAALADLVHQGTSLSVRANSPDHLAPAWRELGAAAAELKVKFEEKDTSAAGQSDKRPPLQSMLTKTAVLTAKEDGSTVTWTIEDSQSPARLVDAILAPSEAGIVAELPIEEKGNKAADGGDDPNPGHTEPEVDAGAAEEGGKPASEKAPSGRGNTAEDSALRANPRAIKRGE